MNNFFYHLKIALRNLRQGNLYSAINIGGLAVSLAVCILISLWVKDELSYDRFHKNEAQIYKVLKINENTEYWETTPAPLAVSLHKDMPQIEKYCRTGSYPIDFLDHEHIKYKDISALAVDTSFFNMFDFTLMRGNIHQPFPDDLSMVISESKAKIIFGDEDPIGKILKAKKPYFPEELTFHVTAVMKDFPGNSSISADFLVRFDVQQRTFPGNGNWTQIEDDWGSYHFNTYVKLALGSNPEAIAGDLSQKNYRLQPLKEIHLYALNGQPVGLKTVYIFSMIALLILIIACINYINLITARASKRRREIAVRKIIGAKKIRLLWQLMNETIILLLVSLVLTTLLIYLLLPFYNEISGKQLSFSLFEPSTLLIYLGTSIVILLLAGLYPAFSLSSFHPVDAFGSDAGKKDSFFRKTLVITQFTISMALIIATIIIKSQLQFMQHMNPGYSKENIFTVNILDMAFQYPVIKEQLLKEPGILSVSGSFNDKMIIDGERTDIWQDKETKQQQAFSEMHVDSNFFSLMNIHFVEGGNFRSGQEENEYHRGIIVNETAAKLIGKGQSVIGMHLDKENAEIVGVVKDFNYKDLHSKIKPLYICYFHEAQIFMYVKAAPGKTQTAIASVEKIWKEQNKNADFSYSFLDADFDKMYKSDLRTGRLFSVFSLVAILISCLGLFGLVTYTAETKTKEIGIRKVLGASVAGIVEMLSKEFLILVGIAMLIAFPLAYYWLDKMLQDYAYRIDISWWMFAVAGAITITLTLLTVGWKAVKAATANPVKAIKSE